MGLLVVGHCASDQDHINTSIVSHGGAVTVLFGLGNVKTYLYHHLSTDLLKTVQMYGLNQFVLLKLVNRALPTLLYQVVHKGMRLKIDANAPPTLGVP
jgi:hypothetical protein